MGQQEKRNRNAGNGGVSVGSSSILVIFVVLALTAFATLALTSANSDKVLTERIAASTQAYYAADAKGVEDAARLKAALSGVPAGKAAEAAASAGWTADGTRFTRSIEIEEGRTLELAAELTTDGLRFTRWQMVNNLPWEEEDNFMLWGGPDSTPDAGDTPLA